MKTQEKFYALQGSSFPQEQCNLRPFHESLDSFRHSTLRPHLPFGPPVSFTSLGEIPLNQSRSLPLQGQYPLQMPIFQALDLAKIIATLSGLASLRAAQESVPSITNSNGAIPELVKLLNQNNEQNTSGLQTGFQPFKIPAFDSINSGKTLEETNEAENSMK